MKLQVPNSKDAAPKELVERNVLGHVGEEAVFQTLLAQDHLPEMLRGGIENKIERSGVGEPGFAVHFVLELAWTPAGVTGKPIDLFGGGKGFAEFHQRVERVTEVQVGHHAGFGKKIVRMQKAERGKLDWATEVKGLVLELIGDISDEHFAEVVAAGTVQDKTEGALGIMLTDKDHRPLKERPVQLAAVQQ